MKPTQPLQPKPGDRAFEILNAYQRDFPLVERPFEQIGESCALSEADVLQLYRDWIAQGVLSRVGGVFHQSAGGASLLAAIAVPSQDLETVAEIVSSYSGVNHNYEREHFYNLWFVMTGPDALTVEAAMQLLERQTGLPALRLPMIRPYRIDLAFNLSGKTAHHGATRATATSIPRVSEAERPLAALVEEGLPLVSDPYAQWKERLGLSPHTVLSTIRGWLEVGILRRFGNVVRHHEMGFRYNAMTVFDLPEERVDAIGVALATTPEVTLSYQRARAPGWNYNLYCMIHGTERDEVNRVIQQILDDYDLRDVPSAVLFSARRFKQTGARRYRDAVYL